MAAIHPGIRTVVDVRRARLDHAGSRWECHRCRGWFPVEMAWSVTAMACGRSFVVIVCPGCAPLYENSPRVVIDLARLDRVGHPSLRGGPLERVAKVAKSAARKRESPTVPRFALRQADIRQIATDLGCTPADVYHRLRASGLLAIDEPNQTAGRTAGRSTYHLVAADSYDHIRDLLALLCREDERVTLVGAVNDLHRAIQLTNEAAADVLLVDERLCGPDLWETMDRARSAVGNVRIILSCDEPSSTHRGGAIPPWDAVVARDNLLDAIDLIVDGVGLTANQ